MKKTIIVLSALLALVACNKETPVKESAIDPSKIVFNINVENGDATKGVKTAWETGDVVYAFFEGNTTQYVKMTYTASYASGYWVYTDKDGGTDYAGLVLFASGKKVSAVYFPSFVCSAKPTYDNDAGKWTFGSSVAGYFQFASGVDYTVTSTSDISTLSATISLAAPDNIMQICIPSSEASAPASGNEYVLTATHIIPYTFSGVVPGGDVSWGTGANGFPMSAYSGSIGGDAGYYFWGILEGTGTYTYDFQLVERNADKKYAISSKSKHVAPGVEISSAAIRLTGLTNNGKFVSLGYAGGPLWATGNIDKTNSTIVDPLEAGEYFMYGKTTPYSASESIYTGTEDPLSTSADVACSVNTFWRIPTLDQFGELIDASNTETVWKEGWTALGSPNGGRLITSKVNGISLFFAAAGYYNGTLVGAGEGGYYGSSTPYISPLPFFSNAVCNLLFGSEAINVNGCDLDCGQSVRPVQN